MLSKSQKPIDINAIFEHFPNKKFWFFFIDQEYWPKNNPYVFDFDQSKQYFSNASKGFFTSLLMVDLPLTVDRITGLHDIGYHKKETVYLGMKEKGISGFDSTSFTHEGLIELIDKIRVDGVKLSFSYTLKSNQQEYLIPLDAHISSESLALDILALLKQENLLSAASLIRATSLEDAIQVAEKYLARYYQEIDLAGDNEEKKLTAIVRFIQDMHQYHPYRDGNGRLFVFFY